MTILITGGAGLVGSHFVERELIKKNNTLLFPTVDELDITSSDKVIQYLTDYSPDVIIHFAAHTDLNKAEEQRGNVDGLVWKINVEGTKNLVDAARKFNCYFIHISTDYVFSAKKDDPGPYTENHPPENDPNRLSWYGWTKRQAEDVVQRNLSNYSILRISNPARAQYDLKLDSVRKILKPYDEGKDMQLFNDQYLTITYVNSVTEVIQELIQLKMNGIFHVSSSNVCTPFSLASYVLKKARGVNDYVKPSSVEDFYKKTGLVNRYAQYGGLDVTETQRKLNIRFGSWESIVDSILNELTQSANKEL